MLLVAVWFAVVLGLGPAGVAAAIEGDPEGGARVCRACLACHSLVPGQHRTGPTLAGVFGRKAGTAAEFRRYSPALRGADVTWTAATLDACLADPRQFLPGNRMTFPGIHDARARADLLAYLAAAAAEGGAGPDRPA